MNQYRNLDQRTNPGQDLFNETRTRRPASERLVRNWPLDRISMTGVVHPDDLLPGSHWPPNRVRRRTRRLQLFEDLFDGDISYFVDDVDQTHLLINYFERIPTLIAAILLTSDPQVPAEDMAPMQVMLADAAIAAIRSGRAYMFRAGEELAATETVFCYDGPAAGQAWCMQRGSAPDATDDTNPSMMTVIYADQDVIITRKQRWGGGTGWRTVYGTLGEVMDQQVDDGTVAIIDRPPRRYGFGRSLYESLIPPVVASALRLAGVERTIAQNEHPLLAIPVANADGPSALGAEGQPSTLSGFSKPAVVRAAQAIRDHDVIWSPDGLKLPQYVEWGANNMSSSFEMLQVLADEVSVLTGVPRMLTSGAEMPSGIAMKRALYALYATTKQLFNLLHTAAEDVYGAEFEWPNPFDAEDDAAMADVAGSIAADTGEPLPTDVEDVL